MVRISFPAAWQHGIAPLQLQIRVVVWFDIHLHQRHRKQLWLSPVTILANSVRPPGLHDGCSLGNAWCEIERRFAGSQLSPARFRLTLWLASLRAVVPLRQPVHVSQPNQLVT